MLPSEAFCRVMQGEAEWIYSGYLDECDRCGRQPTRDLLIAGPARVTLSLCEECYVLVQWEIAAKYSHNHMQAYEDAMAAAVGEMERGQGPEGGERSDPHP